MSQSYLVATTVVRVVNGQLVATRKDKEFKLTPASFHMETHRKDVRYQHVADAELAHTIFVGKHLQRVYRFDDAVVAFMRTAAIQSQRVARVSAQQGTRLVDEKTVLATIGAYARKHAAAEAAAAAAAATKRPRRRTKAKAAAA